MTMTLIQTTTLGTAAASIEFTSIPQDGTDLVILLSLRSLGTVATQINTRFNASGGTAYSDRTLQGSGNNAASGNRTGDAFFRITGIPEITSNLNVFGNVSMYIPNYSSSSSKIVSLDGVTERNATTSYQELVAALWNNTAAITSVAFTSQDATNLAIGSTVSLYKITKGSSGGVVVS